MEGNKALFRGSPVGQTSKNSEATIAGEWRLDSASLGVVVLVGSIKNLFMGPPTPNGAPFFKLLVLRFLWVCLSGFYLRWRLLGLVVNYGGFFWVFGNWRKTWQTSIRSRLIFDLRITPLIHSMVFFESKETDRGDGRKRLCC